MFTRTRTFSTGPAGCPRLGPVLSQRPGRAEAAASPGTERVKGERAAPAPGLQLVSRPRGRRRQLPAPQQGSPAPGTGQLPGPAGHRRQGEVRTAMCSLGRMPRREAGLCPLLSHRPGGSGPGTRGGCGLRMRAKARAVLRHLSIRTSHVSGPLLREVQTPTQGHTDTGKARVQTQRSPPLHPSSHPEQRARPPRPPCSPPPGHVPGLQAPGA